MLWNYLKIALRTLQRDTSYTVINMVGLALGIACCVLLALFVRHEWTYDDFHEQVDRVVHVNRIAPEPSRRCVHLGKGVHGKRPEDDRRCAMAHTQCAVPHSRACLCAA